jgi:hypothetical protein
MNWLERARRELGKGTRGRTDETAEGNPTAVLAVPAPTHETLDTASIGSAVPPHFLKSEDIREAFDERAAIMEYDGGFSRCEAERVAWESVSKRYRLH